MRTKSTIRACREILRGCKKLVSFTVKSAFLCKTNFTQAQTTDATLKKFYSVVIFRKIHEKQSPHRFCDQIPNDSGVTVCLKCEYKQTN